MLIRRGNRKKMDLTSCRLPSRYPIPVIHIFFIQVSLFPFFGATRNYVPLIHAVYIMTHCALYVLFFEWVPQLRTHVAEQDVSSIARSFYSTQINRPRICGHFYNVMLHRVIIPTISSQMLSTVGRLI